MMARRALITVILAIIGSAAAERTPARWCVAKQDELEFCEENLVTMNSGQEYINFSCVLAAEGTDCVGTIAAGGADFTRVGGWDTYNGWVQHGIEAILHFDNEYAAVAVVNKEMCDANPKLSFEDLDGKNMCSTGYRKTAGWVVPTGFLLGRDIMPYVASSSLTAQPDANSGDISVESSLTVQPDAQSVASFFGDVCAARTSSDGPALDPAGDATLWSELCGACSGDCSADEPLYDYQGALRGLMEGKCDVAFTKQPILVEYAKGGPKAADWSTMAEDDMRLLCKNGGCAKIGDYQGCALATSPAHAIVVPDNYPAQGALRSAFMGLLANDGFKSTVLSAEGNPDNLLMSSSIETAVPVYSVPRYLGNIKELFDSYTLAMSPEYQNEITGEPTARFCVAKEDEKDFCVEQLPLMNSAQNHVKFECVLAEGKDCVAAIADDEADFMRTGSYDVYNGWVSSGIEALLALDNEGDGSYAYTAIAAVPKAVCDANPAITLKDLSGKDACFTGYRKTAGWVVPTGYMMAYNIMPYVNNSTLQQPDAQSVASFFGDVCAARTSGNGPALDPTTGEATLWSELCGACKGDCSADEPLYDYEGALRGLMEGKCEVAFTKHSVLAEYAKGGPKEAEWSTMEEDDLRLLCKAGGCATIAEHRNCNFATVPGHAVAAPGTFAHKHLVRDAFKELIVNDDFKSAVLSAEGNPNNYLMEHKVKAAEDVYSTLQYLGPIVEAYDGYTMLGNTQ